MGFSPTVEIPTAIDTAPNELTTSLPVVAPTALTLEVTAHHSVDQHWRPAHDTTVLSAIGYTADRLIVSTVRCRSTSSRQADRRPSTRGADPRIDGSPQRVIDRRSPLARPHRFSGWPLVVSPLSSALDARLNTTATAASNAALRQPRCPADQRRSTPWSSVPTTTIRTAGSDDADSPSNSPATTAVATAISIGTDTIRNVIGSAPRRQQCDSPHSPFSGCISYRMLSAETRCVGNDVDSRIYTSHTGCVPAVSAAVIRPIAARGSTPQFVVVATDNNDGFCSW